MMDNIGGVTFGGTIFNKSTALFSVAESFSIGSDISSMGARFIDSANIQGPMLMGLLGGLVGGILGRLLSSALGGGIQVSPFSLPNGFGNMGLVGVMNPMMPQILNPMIPSMTQMNPQGINNQSLIMLLMILLVMLLNQRGNNGGMNMMPFGNNGNGNFNFNPLPAASCGSCGNPSIPSINEDEIRKLLEEIIKKVEVKELQKKLQEKRDDGLEWECGTSRLNRQMKEYYEELLKKFKDKEKIKINININISAQQAPPARPYYKPPRREDRNMLGIWSYAMAGCGPIYNKAGTSGSGANASGVNTSGAGILKGEPAYSKAGTSGSGANASGVNTSGVGILKGEPAYSKAGTSGSGANASGVEINNLVYYMGYDNVKVIPVAYGRGPVYSIRPGKSDINPIIV